VAISLSPSGSYAGAGVLVPRVAAGPFGQPADDLDRPGSDEGQVGRYGRCRDVTALAVGGETHDRSPHLSGWWLVAEPGTDRAGSRTPVLKVIEERLMSHMVRGVIRSRRSPMMRSKRPTMTIHLPVLVVPVN
jgi:hypothetical protein